MVQGLKNTFTSLQLRAFILLESALGHIQTHRVVFNRPEENLVDGSVILTDPVNVLCTYIDQIWALIETQIQNWGGLGGIKASVSQKVDLRKGTSGDIFILIFQSETKHSTRA